MGVIPRHDFSRLLPLCLLLQWPGFSMGAPSETYSQVPHLTVDRPRLFVEIPDREVAYDVGEKLQLFQKNQYCYVALVESDYEGRYVCAFPRSTEKGQGTAWVTKDNYLVFGVKTHSVPGRFYLRSEEEFPVVRISEYHYLARISRNGEEVDLPIPKAMDGLVLKYRPWEPPSATSIPGDQAVSTESSPPDRRVRTSKDPYLLPSVPANGPIVRNRKRKSTGGFISAEQITRIEPFVNITFLPPPKPPEPEPAEQTAAVEPPPVAEEEPGPAEVAEVLTAPEELPVEDLSSIPEAPMEIVAYVPDDLHEEPIEAPDVLTDPLPPPEELAKVDTPPSDPGPPRMSGVLHFVARNRLGIGLAMVLMIGVGVFLSHRGKKNTVAGGKDVKVPRSASRIVDNREQEGIFSGSLEGFGIAELIQFLNASRETGTLLVSDLTQSVLHQIFFRDGEMVDAIAGSQSGEKAVREIMLFRQGSFTFAREEPPTGESQIEQSTMSLLLEVHKELDEKKEPRLPEEAIRWDG